MTTLTILIAVTAVAWTVVLPSLIVAARVRRVRLEQARDCAASGPGHLRVGISTDLH